MWATKGVQRPIIGRKKLTFEAVAAIAVIDDRGLLTIAETKQKSYKEESFNAFITRFLEVAEKPSTLVLDNLGFHKNEKVREMCREQGVTIIYNGTYSSQFMPVEMIWNMAKVYWRREIINVPNFSNKTNLRHRIELCI